MRFRPIQYVLLVAGLGIPACTAADAPGQGREASAIGSLRAIVSAEMAYAVACANNGFAQALEDLGKPEPGSTTAFIGPDLTTSGVVKSGYVVTLRAGDGATVQTAAADTCNGSSHDAMSTFFAEAHPDAATGMSGRSFAADQRGAVYVRDDGQVIGPDMSGARMLE